MAKRMSKHSRKTRSKRHRSRSRGRGKGTRKFKGGNCYGSGIGSNNYDPNYSIYNTRMSKLFPY